MKDFLRDAKTLQKQCVKWRRHLHKNPEIGLNLPDTSAFVKQQLEEMGYEATLVAGSGVTAIAGGKRPGKCFLLRADMDALPIKEEAETAFCSDNGYMHACGHDFHTAMLLGAAKLLKEHESEITGTVKLMFQPGEETLQGAKAMVDAGILNAPKVDAAAMFHVAVGMPFPSGTIVVPGQGALSAASDSFEIDIQGRGGHGAMPDSTVDPLNVMSHLHLALQSIVSREVSASDSAVLSICAMQGGQVYNVIPDTARLKGTVRTFNQAVRKHILQRVQSISQTVAETFRARAEVNLIHGCPSVIVDGKVADDVRASLAEVFGNAVPAPSALDGAKMNGSEDFSFVTQQVPSVMMMISAGSQEEGYRYPVHHPKVRFNEEILSQGAAAYAIAAMGWLEKNPVDC